MKLILENVRSFAGRHELPIKPLTILTGENSSGKSTFLAALSVVSNRFGFPMQPKFNDPPYSLGSFDTIATYRGGSHGREKTFSLGYIHDQELEENRLEAVATYMSEQGQVELASFRVKSNVGELYLNLAEGTDSESAILLTQNIDGKKHSTKLKFDRALRVTGNFNFFDLVHSLIYELHKTNVENWRRWSGMLLEMNETAFRPTRTLSIAPIRTKPSRTYDQVTDDFNPEGAHIPLILARIFNEKPNSRERKQLLNALEKFGNESGLFKTVGVKKLGSNISDPFQIMITAAGRPANLLDVGYGVSQALPVVVQSVLLSEPRLLLLQQPEVHLHPKAQAALGTFFVDLVTKANKQFVIETHSDYILDRVRQEVALGHLDNESVIILFFEKNGTETTVHQISLDKYGNITGAPPSYRAFFLREEINLLNRTGGRD